MPGVSMTAGVGRGQRLCGGGDEAIELRAVDAR